MQGNDIYNAATARAVRFQPQREQRLPEQPEHELGHRRRPPRPRSLLGRNWTNLAPDLQGAGGGQFSLGMQHELKPSMIWVVQYVGNLAWHQNILHHINNYPDHHTDLNIRCNAGDGSDKYAGDRLPATPVRSGDRAEPGRLPISLPYLSGLLRTSNQEENTTNGNYNGFQTGLRIQNKWGLSGEIDYTYSHEIDITSLRISAASATPGT